MDLPIVQDDATTTPLPPLYARWVEQLVGGVVPAEHKATCDDCVMLRDEEEKAATTTTGEVFFDSQTRCCTYVPLLPNYLVGAVLNDGQPAMAFGRDTVRRRIAEGVAVTPLGLGRDADFHAIYASDPNVFGRHPGLRCPHQNEAGLCGIWLHRNSVCATWFCKYARGETGYQFWRAVLQLLGEIEAELSAYCVQEVGLDPGASARLFDMALTGLNDSGRASSADDVAHWKATWGEWADRREAFYEACAERVADMDADDVLSLTGQRVRAAAGLVKAAYDRLTSEKLPSRLKAGSFKVLQFRSDTALDRKSVV